MGSVPVVLVRGFEPRDVAAVLDLNNANVPALNELDAAEVTRLAGIADAALVAEVDGRFAGFCWVLSPGKEYGSLNYGWFSRNFSDFVYLDRIAVAPEFRRYGIGRAFYQELVERFTLEKVGVSPATFDYAKLDWMNGEWIRRITLPELEAHPAAARLAVVFGGWMMQIMADYMRGIFLRIPGLFS